MFILSSIQQIASALGRSEEVVLAMATRLSTDFTDIRSVFKLITNVKHYSDAWITG